MCKTKVNLSWLENREAMARQIVEAARDEDGLTLEECSDIMCETDDCGKLMDVMKDGYVSAIEFKWMGSRIRTELFRETSEMRNAEGGKGSLGVEAAERVVEEASDLDGLTEADCAEIGLKKDACEEMRQVYEDSEFSWGEYDSHMMMYYPYEFKNYLWNSDVVAKRIEAIRNTNSKDEATVRSLLDLMDYRRKGSDGEDRSDPHGTKVRLAGEAAVALGRIGPVNDDVIPTLIDALYDKAIAGWSPAGCWGPCVDYAPSKLAQGAVHALAEIGPAARDARFKLWRMKAWMMLTHRPNMADQIDIAFDSVRGK